MEALNHVQDELQKMLSTVDSASTDDVKSNIAKILINITVAKPDGLGGTENIGTIASLERELELARYKLDAMQLREERTQAALTELQSETAKLRSIVDQQEALARDEGLSLKDLLGLKSTFEAARQELAEKCSYLEEHLETLKLDLVEVQSEKSRAEDRADSLQKDMEGAAHENKLLRSTKKTTDSTIERLSSELEDVQQLFSESQVILQSYGTQKVIFEKKIAELEEENLEAAKKLEILLTKLQSISSDCDILRDAYKSVEHENNRMSTLVKELETHCSTLQKDTLKIQKQKNVTLARLDALKKECGKAEDERTALDQQLNTLERDLEELKQAATRERSTVDALGRERDSLIKHIKTLQNMSENQTSVNVVQHGTLRKLESEVQVYRIGEERTRAVINSLELKKDSLEGEVRKSMQEAQILKSMVANAKAVEKLLHTKLSVCERQLWESKQRVDKLCEEKMKVDADYIKARERAEHAEDEIKKLAHLVDQYKDENNDKDVKIKKHVAKIECVQRDLESFRTTAEDTKKVEEETKKILVILTKEKEKMEKIIIQKDRELKKQNFLITEVTREKEVLQKNIQKKLSVEKCRASTEKDHSKTIDNLKASETQLISNVKQLELETASLREENLKLQQKITELGRLEQSVRKLELDLAEERLRCSALENDKRVPIRVHPLHELEALEPDSYEVLLRMQTVKREMILRPIGQRRRKEHCPPIGMTGTKKAIREIGSTARNGSIESQNRGARGRPYQSAERRDLPNQNPTWNDTHDNDYDRRVTSPTKPTGRYSGSSPSPPSRRIVPPRGPGSQEQSSTSRAADSRRTVVGDDSRRSKKRSPVPPVPGRGQKQPCASSGKKTSESVCKPDNKPSNTKGDSKAVSGKVPIRKEGSLVSTAESSLVSTAGKIEPKADGTKTQMKEQKTSKSATPTIATASQKSSGQTVTSTSCPGFDSSKPDLKASVSSVVKPNPGVPDAKKTGPSSAPVTAHTTIVNHVAEVEGTRVEKKSGATATPKWGVSGSSPVESAMTSTVEISKVVTPSVKMKEILLATAKTVPSGNLGTAKDVTSSVECCDTVTLGNSTPGLSRTLTVEDRSSSSETIPFVRTAQATAQALPKLMEPVDISGPSVETTFESTKNPARKDSNHDEEPAREATNRSERYVLPKESASNLAVNKTAGAARNEKDMPTYCTYRESSSNVIESGQFIVKDLSDEKEITKDKKMKPVKTAVVEKAVKPTEVTIRQQAMSPIPLERVPTLSLESNTRAASDKASLPQELRPSSECALPQQKHGSSAQPITDGAPTGITVHAMSNGHAVPVGKVEQLRALIAARKKASVASETAKSFGGHVSNDFVPFGEEVSFSDLTRESPLTPLPQDIYKDVSSETSSGSPKTGRCWKPKPAVKSPTPPRTKSPAKIKSRFRLVATPGPTGGVVLNNFNISGSSGLEARTAELLAGANRITEVFEEFYETAKPFTGTRGVSYQKDSNVSVSDSTILEPALIDLTCDSGLIVPTPRISSNALPVGDDYVHLPGLSPSSSAPTTLALDDMTPVYLHGECGETFQSQETQKGDSAAKTAAISASDIPADVFPDSSQALTPAVVRKSSQMVCSASANVAQIVSAEPASSITAKAGAENPVPTLTVSSVLISSKQAAAEHLVAQARPSAPDQSKPSVGIAEEKTPSALSKPKQAASERPETQVINPHQAPTKAVDIEMEKPSVQKPSASNRNQDVSENSLPRQSAEITSLERLATARQASVDTPNKIAQVSPASTKLAAPASTNAVDRTCATSAGTLSPSSTGTVNIPTNTMLPVVAQSRPGQTPTASVRKEEVERNQPSTAEPEKLSYSLIKLKVSGSGVHPATSHYRATTTVTNTTQLRESQRGSVSSIRETTPSASPKAAQSGMPAITQDQFRPYSSENPYRGPQVTSPTTRLGAVAGRQSLERAQTPDAQAERVILSPQMKMLPKIMSYDSIEPTERPLQLQDIISEDEPPIDIVEEVVPPPQSPALMLPTILSYDSLEQDTRPLPPHDVLCTDTLQKKVTAEPPTQLEASLPQILSYDSLEQSTNPVKSRDSVSFASPINTATITRRNDPSEDSLEDLGIQNRVVIHGNLKPIKINVAPTTEKASEWPDHKQASTDATKLGPRTPPETPFDSAVGNITDFRNPSPPGRMLQQSNTESYLGSTPTIQTDTRPGINSLTLIDGTVKHVQQRDPRRLSVDRPALVPDLPSSTALKTSNPMPRRGSLDGMSTSHLEHTAKRDEARPASGESLHLCRPGFQGFAIPDPNKNLMNQKELSEALGILMEPRLQKTAIIEKTTNRESAAVDSAVVANGDESEDSVSTREEARVIEGVKTSLKKVFESDLAIRLHFPSVNLDRIDSLEEIRDLIQNMVDLPEEVWNPCSTVLDIIQMAMANVEKARNSIPPTPASSIAPESQSRVVTPSSDMSFDSELGDPSAENSRSLTSTPTLDFLQTTASYIPSIPFREDSPSPAPAKTNSLDPRRDRVLSDGEKDDVANNLRKTLSRLQSHPPEPDVSLSPIGPSIALTLPMKNFELETPAVGIRSNGQATPYGQATVRTARCVEQIVPPKPAVLEQPPKAAKQPVADKPAEDTANPDKLNLLINQRNYKAMGLKVKKKTNLSEAPSNEQSQHTNNVFATEGRSSRESSVKSKAAFVPSYPPPRKQRVAHEPRTADAARTVPQPEPNKVEEPKFIQHYPPLPKHRISRAPPRPVVVAHVQAPKPKVSDGGVIQTEEKVVAATPFDPRSLAEKPGDKLKQRLRHKGLEVERARNSSGDSRCSTPGSSESEKEQNKDKVRSGGDAACASDKGGKQKVLQRQVSVDAERVEKDILSAKKKQEEKVEGLKKDKASMRIENLPRQVSEEEAERVKKDTLRDKRNKMKDEEKVEGLKKDKAGMCYENLSRQVSEEEAERVKRDTLIDKRNKKEEEKVEVLRKEKGDICIENLPRQVSEEEAERVKKDTLPDKKNKKREEEKVEGLKRDKADKRSGILSRQLSQVEPEIAGTKKEKQAHTHSKLSKSSRHLEDSPKSATLAPDEKKKKRHRSSPSRKHRLLERQDSQDSVASSASSVGDNRQPETSGRGRKVVVDVSKKTAPWVADSGSSNKKLKLLICSPAASPARPEPTPEPETPEALLARFFRSDTEPETSSILLSKNTVKEVSEAPRQPDQLVDAQSTAVSSLRNFRKSVVNSAPAETPATSVITKKAKKLSARPLSKIKCGKLRQQKASKRPMGPLSAIASKITEERLKELYDGRIFMEWYEQNCRNCGYLFNTLLYASPDAETLYWLCTSCDKVIVIRKPDRPAEPPAGTRFCEKEKTFVPIKV